MSYHLTQKLPITDENVLEAAVQQMGFALSRHRTPVAVRGWDTEVLATRCELVIQRENSGKGADIGFHRETDGSFTLVSDEFANEDMGGFIASLKRTYQEVTAIRKGQAQGLRVVSRGKWITREGKRFLQLKLSR